MSGKPRDAVLERLCASILALEISGPLRVAIDGRTASGKTIFADELAALVEARGRKPIRTSIDGFHNPKAERYARGRYSAEGYYFDARDLSAFAYFVAPLGPAATAVSHRVLRSGDRQADRANADDCVTR